MHTSSILSKRLLHRLTTLVTPLRPRSIVNEGNDCMDNATHTRVKFISSDQLIHRILASSSIFYAIPFETYSYGRNLFGSTFIFLKDYVILAYFHKSYEVWLIIKQKTLFFNIKIMDRIYFHPLRIIFQILYHHLSTKENTNMLNSEYTQQLVPKTFGLNLISQMDNFRRFLYKLIFIRLSYYHFKQNIKNILDPFKPQW